MHTPLAAVATFLGATALGSFAAKRVLTEPFPLIPAFRQVYEHYKKEQFKAIVPRLYLPPIGEYPVTRGS